MLGQAVPAVPELLGEPRGLHVVRYAGGDSFRAASNLLHFTVTGPVGATQRDNIIQEAQLAADRWGYDTTMPQTPAMCIDWAGAVWESAILVTSHVHGAGDNLANLFYHGWLHEDAARQGRPGAGAFPLIGLLSCAGELKPDPSGGLAAAGSGEPGQALAPADQHIHSVEQFGTTTQRRTSKKKQEKRRRGGGAKKKKRNKRRRSSKSGRRGKRGGRRR